MLLHCLPLLLLLIIFLSLFQSKINSFFRSTKLLISISGRGMKKSSSSNSASSRMPGHRFQPTDHELINDFLKPKIFCSANKDQFLTDIKVCDYEPWELPSLVSNFSDDQVWYFFCCRSRRSNRRTKVGFWKSTGKPRKVMDHRTKKQIGTKRSIVFHIKNKPKPIRTKWIMHEYEYIVPNSTSAIQGNFVLCKLMSKSADAEDINQDESSNLKLDEIATNNSSCDESTLNINVTFDFESHNLSGMTVIDCSADDENYNSNATSTYVNSKLNFENYQNLNVKMDEWSKEIVLLHSDFDLQIQNEKNDGDITVNADGHPLATTPSEGDIQAYMRSLEELLKPDKVDKLNSAILPPMSPSESGSCLLW